jgi:ribose/xylose/arabinose/galactoside ABC-type transport system permease subunit
MFAAVVLGGVLLWPARTAPRSVAVGGLVILLVLCGVFMPTFSRQVLNGVLGAAILVVVVLWLVEYLRHRPPRRRAPAGPPSPPPAPPDQPVAEAKEGGAAHA